MLYRKLTDGEVRTRFRKLLAGRSLVRLPGVPSPLTARLVERHGFEGAYVSGAVVAADLGLPDVGLTTLSEVATRCRQITRMTDLPVIADADTGFGEVLNVARAVQELEDAGLAGIHIEDQMSPKRCGHLDGKAVVDDATAAQRVKAAVSGRRDPNFVLIARTDLRVVGGLDAAIERARLLADAGADVIFPEALRTLDEFERMCSAVQVPVLANMTEFGKSELFTTSELHAVGVRLVIWPVSLLRLAMGAADRALATLSSEGSFASLTAQMQHRSDLYELVDYGGYSQLDSSVFDFSIETL
ncbi:methylisocitrate lyase [Intrasporangium sp. DVR]|uniref:methylisocitrate lyase n=1 Tax=Intrasporangium sp. DVR TaxID=3127867 RepID=UPI00313A6276